MAVKIKLANGLSASILNGIWTSEIASFKKLLRFFDYSIIENYTPWSDYTIAQMAANALGGKITKATNRPKYVKGRVY